MSRIYEGPEPCPGCGTPGTRRARLAKNQLCEDCKKALEIGATIVKERGLERNFYRMDDLTMAHITWYKVPIKEIEWALKGLLETFSQFDSRYADWNREYFGQMDPLTGHHDFVLPKVTYDAAKVLTEKIMDFCWQLRREKEEYKKQLEAEVNEERNRIYNEGVAYGRNLLTQLNRGEIALSDFEATVKKY